MTQSKLGVPVALIIFNRPLHTSRVFERIREARPGRLMVIADGARPGRPGEAEKCAETRSQAEKVDWDCEVLTNYSDVNLGCRNRVSSGLDWVFDKCESAIVLEDDCLPDSSFFRYCAELLDYYRDNDRVAAISGDNFQFGNTRIDDSYYFSIYPHAWGWATWRRVWKHYDVGMADWPALRDSGWLEELLGDSRVALFWREAFQAVFEGRLDTWDHQWTFTCWKQGGLTALPAENLISNIGFGPEATHTRRGSKFSRMATGSLDFPLRHPAKVERNLRADHFTQRQNYTPGIVWKARRLLQRFLSPVQAG